MAIENNVWHLVECIQPNVHRFASASQQNRQLCSSGQCVNISTIWITPWRGTHTFRFNLWCSKYFWTEKMEQYLMLRRRPLLLPSMLNSSVVDLHESALAAYQPGTFGKCFVSHVSEHVPNHCFIVDMNRWVVPPFFVCFNFLVHRTFITVPPLSSLLWTGRRTTRSCSVMCWRPWIVGPWRTRCSRTRRMNTFFEQFAPPLT